MTGQGNDWSQWGELWRDQPAVDVARLRRDAARKRWRMRGMVVLEILTSLFACAQCVWLMLHVTGRWQLWSVASLLLVVLIQGLYLHVRRGTWRASGNDVHHLLQLTLRRAEAGIQLARVNLWGMLALVVFTLMISEPELEPSRWEADPRLRLTLVLQFAVNGPLVIAVVALCAWYIRRQRTKIGRVKAILSMEDASAHRL